MRPYTLFALMLTLPILASAQFTNQYGTSSHAYLPGPGQGTSSGSTGLSSGGINAGTPYFNAARGMMDIVNQNMQRNNQIQNQPSYDSSYDLPPYIPPPTPQQLAAQQRAAEALMREQQRAAEAAQRAADEAARKQAREAAEEQKRIEAEDRIANGYLKTAKAGTTKTMEARIMELEQREAWKKASNRIWDSDSKDPWGEFDRRLQEWDNSLAALNEKVLNTPPSKSKRPTVSPDGRLTTLKEQTARDDNAWLQQINSPHAKYDDKPASQN